MNCLGRDNYVYFVSLMASLGVLLSYGACLAYSLLLETLQSDIGGTLDGIDRAAVWRKDKSWSQIFSLWALAFAQNVRIGAVGMLAFLTAPLAWGLFAYHIYLIWAGMTTNESAKWADWRDDITDGLVFRAERMPVNIESMQTTMDIEPHVDWPISSKQQLVRSHDGQPPKAQVPNVQAKKSTLSRNEDTAQQQRWRQVQSLDEVDNIYDLGFEDNLKDILPG